jgi:hypothetical protein
LVDAERFTPDEIDALIGRHQAGAPEVEKAQKRKRRPLRRPIDVVAPRSQFGANDPGQHH